MGRGVRGVFGDPAAIRRLAGQVSAEAERTRGDAQRTAAAVSVGWQSLAAEGYRRQLESAAVSVRVAAGSLDEVAVALRRHAQSVEHQLDLIVTAQHWLKGQAERAWQDVRSAEAMAMRVTGGLVHGAQQVAGTVVSGVEGLLGVGGSGPQAWQQVNELTRRAQTLDRMTAGLPGVDPRWVELARSHGWAG